MKLSLINPKPENICAIDASTNSLAFSIFKDGELFRFGKINFEGKTTYDKVGDAARKSLAFFKHFEVDAIVIEQTVYMNSPKTAADLALVQGALLGGAMSGGIKQVGTINPIAWQTFINNGKLTAMEKTAIMTEFPGKSKSWYKNKEREIRKNKTIKFVNTYFDRDISDNDVADAVGIGYYALNNWGKIFGS